MQLLGVPIFIGSRSRTIQSKQAGTKQETKPMNIISLIIEAISGAVGGMGTASFLVVNETANDSA
jgi:hypothetical protein